MNHKDGGKTKSSYPKSKRWLCAKGTYLEAKGVYFASSKARSAISDFKKYLSDKVKSDLVLNAGETGKELYPTQELGLWLYNRRQPYSGFSTPFCPFDIPTIQASNQNLSAIFSIGQVVATGTSTYEELLEEMRILTANLVEKDRQLQFANQIILAYEKKNRNISARNSKNAKKKRPRSF